MAFVAATACALSTDLLDHLLVPAGYNEALI